MVTKKLASLFLLILSVALMSACSENTKPTIDDRLNDENVLEFIEGKVVGISQNIYQKGTHEFETSDGETIYLQSAKVNLNKYIGETVVVEGELKKGGGNAKPVMTVSAVEYAKNQADGERELYENRALGLKFEHPKTWLQGIVEEGKEVHFSFEEKKVVVLTVFDGEDLNALANEKEEGEGEEVTVAAQSALRFASGESIVLYLPNPPKKKIYQIRFSPDEALVNSGKVEGLKEQFYDLVESIELIYTSVSERKPCGGELGTKCPANFFCQLEDNSPKAEGLCVEVGSAVESSDCPVISIPSECEDYRVAEYKNNCPIRYECPGDAIEKDETEPELESSQPPALSPQLEVSSVFVSKTGYSVSYPKNWYFASFGPQEGNQGSVGFSETAIDGLEGATITMTIQEKDGGKASKKVGDLYYVFDGPAELKDVMEVMAASVEGN